MLSTIRRHSQKITILNKMIQIKKITYTLSLIPKTGKFFSKRALKQVIPETYLKTSSGKIEPEGPKNQVEIIDFERKNYQRGLVENEKPIPVSSKLGPIQVSNPTISDKVYRWCACGLSKSQPFCDGSHKGTKFLPIRFTIEEYCSKIDLCGCKLSKDAPYCDGQTCLSSKVKQPHQPPRHTITVGEENKKEQENQAFK